MNWAPHPGISAALRLHSTTASYASGVSVFRLGAPAHFVFLVETGIVRLRRLGREGEEIVLHEAGPGDFFAEASLDSHRYHCEAVAMGATKLLRIPTAALRTLLDSDSAFAREWSALLAARLRAARARVERLSLRSASERVRHLLVSEGRGAQFEIPIAGTLKDMARTLGLTHETLYRTIAAMERDGTIERRSGRIRFRR